MVYWDGNPTTQTVDTMKLGPGAQLQSDDSTLEADTANTVSDESVIKYGGIKLALSRTFLVRLMVCNINIR